MISWGWPALAALAALAAPAAGGRWDDVAVQVGATASELGIRPERFPTPLTIPSVERLLADPAAGYDEAAGWGRDLSRAQGLSGPLRLGRALLFDAAGSTDAASGGVEIPGCAGLVPGLAASVARLESAVGRAQEASRKAAAVFTEPERARLLESFGYLARHRPLAAVTENDVALAMRFDPDAMIAAAQQLALAAEAELAKLKTAALGPASRWRCGATLVSGPGDDAYGPGDLEGVTLLVDLGGRNRYDAAPVAAAAAGQASLAIDLGSELVFDSASPAFGSGVFGIALLYAPEPGPKIFTAGDLSLGAGFFGAGGVLAAGPSVSATSAHFSQGAGAFGAGVFSVSGASAALKADFASQGYGLTRGAGLWLARGDSARAECGLRHPDPRENLALISLCQGVGHGPRAHAAGGMGLALVEGRGAALRSSYFAQGAGYWHAFGGLYARGDDSFAQARRYSQGTGVHAGAGFLSWRGSNGRLVNWGVGPSFGWDYGVGLLELRGDRNALRADWASGRGDVNGRALAEITGDGNLLALNDWGTGSFKRIAAGYALTRVAGTGNRLWSPGLPAARAGEFDVLATPWGVTRGMGKLLLDPVVAVATAPWPSVDRGIDAREESEAMARALYEADALPPAARARRWLALASSFSLDSQGTMSAAGRLLSLPREQAGVVVRELTVEGFDEALWVRLTAAAAGRTATREALAELPRARGLRRVLLADLLRFGSAQDAVPVAEGFLKDPDWRLRRAGAGLLGAMLGDEGGEEPGRLTFLEQALELARSTFTADSPQEIAAFKAIGIKRLADFYAALALDPGLSARDRVALLASGDPFDTAKTATLRAFAEVLRRSPAVYGAALQAELEISRALRFRARAALRAAIGDSDPDARAGALAALGQVGARDDAARLGAALSDRAASPRAAAALGLARLGSAARGEILARLADPSPDVRRLAVLAAAESADSGVVALLRQGFADSDARVRLAAVAALGAVQSPYYSDARSAAVSDLERLAAGDSDPSVSASAARLLGQIAPAKPPAP